MLLGRGLALWLGLARGPSAAARKGYGAGRAFNMVNYMIISNLGLGAFLVERSFFPENERNDQERSHHSEKKERSECVLKIFGTIS